MEEVVAKYFVDSTDYDHGWHASMFATTQARRLRKHLAQDGMPDVDVEVSIDSDKNGEVKISDMLGDEAVFPFQFRGDYDWHQDIFKATA